MNFLGSINVGNSLTRSFSRTLLHGINYNGLSRLGEGDKKQFCWDIFVENCQVDGKITLIWNFGKYIPRTGGGWKWLSFLI
jgi:hypothetical protein